MKVVFAREAETDLEAIGDFIASESPAQALAFVQALRMRCERLADMPRRLPLAPRYEATGVRRMVHGNFLVFDRVTANTVEILQILHGARDYDALLFPTE